MGVHPAGSRILGLGGKVRGFEWGLGGRVGTGRGRMVPPQARALASIRRSLEGALRDLGGPAPKIQAEFDLEIGRPEESRAEILMTASRNVWKGVALRQVELRATMAGGGVKLEKFRIGVERGEVEVAGWGGMAAGGGGGGGSAGDGLLPMGPPGG